MKPDANQLVTMIRLSLPAFCGDRRYRCSWEDQYEGKPPTEQFTKLIKVRRWKGTVPFIGAANTINPSLLLIPVECIANRPSVTEMENRIQVITFGYRRHEKPAEITTDFLVMTTPPPNVMGIQEVEDNRMFNRAAKLLGINPDVNSHYSFPDQLRETHIDRAFATIDVFAEKGVEIHKPATDSADFQTDFKTTYLFLGTQPAAAFCSMARKVRWRSSNKQSFIFSHPLLSTAFYPNQSITNYAWHPTHEFVLALCDASGRVTVWDLRNIRILMYRKTNRFIQAGWISADRSITIHQACELRAPSIPDSSDASQLLLLLYHGHRGVIEYIDISKNVVARDEEVSMHCPRSSFRFPETAIYIQNAGMRYWWSLKRRR